MPKYLIQASYTAEGAAGLRKEGAVKRKAAVANFIKSAGGKLEAFYFALGDTDVYAITEAPDAETAAAFSVASNGTGAVRLRTTPLLTAEEMDSALKKAVTYRPPGA
jgi:uncharacterized protein with GYD domain